MAILDFGKKRRELEMKLEEQKNQIETMHEMNSRIRRSKLEARRSYAGAAMDRLTSAWNASVSSIDAEIRSSLPRLRQRSRQLGRDNDYAKNAFRTIQNNVIGQGVGLQSQVMASAGRNRGKLDERTNAAIEMAWFKWSQRQNCDVTGKNSLGAILRLIIHSVAESGEIIVREVYSPMGNCKVPLALELIEADRLDDGYNDPKLANGNTVRMGVEVNKWGRPVAYHFLSSHPGDYQHINGEPKAGKRIRVPASEVHHIYSPDGRAGQTRGVPWLHSTILRLHHMQGMEEAEVISARAGASLMGFIESTNPDALVDDVDSGDQVTDFEPGLIKKLAPGEKMNVPNIARTNTGFSDFMRLMLRGVASGVGTSYESLSKDYSQSNYSSSRLALLDDREVYKILQSWIGENFLQPLFERWLSLAVLSGELNLPNYYVSPDSYSYPRWKFRGWSWIDPQKEVGAYKDAVRSGFMTQADVIAQTSDRDFEELIAQRKREVEMADDAELIFDTDPKYVSNAGLTQSRPAGTALPNTDPDAEPAPAEGAKPAQSGE